MNPQHRFDSEVWALLQDIQKERLSLLTGEPLVYKYKSVNEAIKLGLPAKRIAQQKLLRKLVEIGAFEIELTKVDSIYSRFPELFGPDTKEEAAVLQLGKSFDEFYATYEEKFNKTVTTSITPDTSDGLIEVRLVKDGADLLLVTPSEKILLSRLKTGLVPERLFSALINNRTGKLVRAAELRHEVDGLAGLKDISEVIRQAGFGKDLKRIFFKHCGKNEVELRNPAHISEAELAHTLATYRVKP